MSVSVLSDGMASVSSRLRTAGLAALGVALLGVGAVLWWWDRQTAFGWFAYTPLDPQSAQSIVLLTGRRQAALAVSLLGLVLLSGLVGFRVGRRSSRRPPAGTRSCGS